MKSVLVSQRVEYFPESNETRDCLDQELVNFIKHCNYLPVPVPNKLFVYVLVVPTKLYNLRFPLPSSSI